jgi:hypothetical protein
VQRVSQLINKAPGDTVAYNELPPRQKDVVNDFYNQVNYDTDDVVKEVEKTIDDVSVKHEVNTDVIYNYIDKELGA